MRHIICGLIILAIIAPAHAARVVLATKGQPAATIVLPAAANDREKLAATELQHYVKAICGVELPLKTDGKAVTGTGLYIGQCEPTLDSDVPGKDLNPESTAVHVRDGSVFFTGRYPTPTYWAVGSFIENALGVRWFAPGEAWEYVPAGRPGELSVEVKDAVSVPTTSPRIWSGHAWTDDWKTWNLRNRAVLGEVVPRRQFQNFVHRVLPPSKYGQTHPEYYPLINGKRWIPPNDTESAWRPCESSPEVQRLVVEYARKWFDDNPTIDSFSVGMDDISHLCGCENCRAWDPRPDSYEKHEFSDRHYQFVNAIARELAKTHPDRYVGTLIYAIARNLPETVHQLEPNVFGFVTETSAHWYYPDIKRADQALSREWARRCRHLSRYDYFGMGGITPRVYPHLMAEQLKFDKSLGFEGMYTEVYTFLPNTAPMMYAFAKLQWDQRQDVDKLLGEFYSRMFGPAAGTMKRYFDLLEKSWCTPREGRKGRWVHRNLQVQALALAPADVDAGFRLLRQAASEAQTAPEQARIECLRAALEYGSYPIKTYALAQQLVQMPTHDEASVNEVLGLMQQLARLGGARERCWAAAPQRQDLLGETVRGLGEMGYMPLAQMPQLEQGASLALGRVLTWVEQATPAQREAVLRQVTELARLSNFGAAAAAWLQVKPDTPNLLVNGNFEDRGGNEQAAEHDWSTRGAPKGWSTWSSGGQGKFALLPGKGRNGSIAAGIGEVGSSACYLQTVPVKPGERYLVVDYVRTDPAGAQAGPTLMVRFRNPDGGWHPREDLEPMTAAVAGVAGWQPLLLLVEVPEGAGGLLVMPLGHKTDPGAAALHDDIAVYKVE